MNSVSLIGRLTRDPEVRYTGENMAIATFSIAIDRPPRRDGTRETDFPRITVFGRQAENCEKYLAKGRLVGIEGRIQTGSYTNRNGDKVYTTDVVANRVEFLEWGDRQGQSRSSYGQNIQSAPGMQGGQNRQQDPGSGNFGGGYSSEGSFGGNDFGTNDFGNGGSFRNTPAEGQQGNSSADDSIPVGFAPLDEDDIPF